MSDQQFRATEVPEPKGLFRPERALPNRIGARALARKGPHLGMLGRPICTSEGQRHTVPVGSCPMPAEATR